MKNIPKLRFSEFNDEWKEAKLGDLVENFEYGMNASAKKFDNINKYIRITDINENTNKYSSKSSVSPSGLLEDKYLVKENDILFTRTGASTGKTYIYNKDDGKLYFAGFLIRANVIKSYNSKFVFFQTLTEKYNRWVKVISMRSGQPGINAEEYANYCVNTPLIEEQEKIASFFTLIDKKIVKQSEKIELLKDYKKGMIQKIFSQDIRFPGFNYEWKKYKAKNLFDSISDKEHNGELEVLSATQDRGVIPRSKLNIDIKFEKDNLKSYKKIKKNDFIISLRSFQGGIERSNYIGLISPAYAVFNFKKNISGFNCDFFAIILKSNKFINILNTLTYGIRDGKSISFNDFSSLTLEIPSLKEQEKIATFFSLIDKKIEKEKEKLELLNKYKKGLLQQMFV